MYVNVTSPNKLEFHQWVERLNLDFRNGIIIPKATPVEDWWRWANTIIAANRLGSVPLPSISTYPEEEDWRSWAEEFKDSFNDSM